VIQRRRALTDTEWEGGRHGDPDLALTGLEIAAGKKFLPAVSLNPTLRSHHRLCIPRALDITDIHLLWGHERWVHQRKHRGRYGPCTCFQHN
jgi:hypothetical protein